MRSIIQQKKECYACHTTIGLECHHVFGGTANRKMSEKYGLKVWLCNDHHTGANGIHRNQDMMDRMHMIGQMAFEKEHSKDEFIKIFGKNYL